MSRYAVAHAKPNGPGDARPTALQIIKDEGVEGKLKVWIRRVWTLEMSVIGLR